MAAVPNYGLLSTMADGIKEGLIGFQTMAASRRSQQMQDMQAQSQGYEKDENGNYVMNDQVKDLMNQHRQLQAKQFQNENDAFDPTSKLSDSSRQMAKGYLNQIKPATPADENGEGGTPGLGDQTITDDMSKSDIDGLLQHYDKFQSGLMAKKYQADMGYQGKQLGADTSIQNTNTKAQATQNQFSQRQGLMNERIGQGDERIHNQNLSKVNSDPIATGLLTTYNNLQNSVSNFDKGGRTPQEFGELQQSLRSNLGIKGTSGVDERGETYWKSVGLSGDKVKQILFGDPVDVTNSDPKAVEMILGLAKNEMANKQTQYQAQVNKLKAGHSTFYKNHPELSQDYDATVSAGLGQMGQPSQGAGLMQPAQGGGQVGNNAPQMQGTDQMTPDVMNYAKTHNITPAQALAVKLQRAGQ